MTTRRHSVAPRAVRGQAVAEFAIALVGLMVVFIGLIQICHLGFKNVEAAHLARANAEEQLAIGTPTFAFGRDIGSWRNGRDGLAYTGDDKSSPNANSALDNFNSQLHAGVIQLSAMAPTTYGINNSFSPPLVADSLVLAADLFSGTGNSNVTIDPVLQRWLSLPASFRVSDTAAMAPLKIDAPVQPTP